MRDNVSVMKPRLSQFDGRTMPPLIGCMTFAAPSPTGTAFSELQVSARVRVPLRAMRSVLASAIFAHLIHDVVEIRALKQVALAYAWRIVALVQNVKCSGAESKTMSPDDLPSGDAKDSVAAFRLPCSRPKPTIAQFWMARRDGAVLVDLLPETLNGITIRGHLEPILSGVTGRDADTSPLHLFYYGSGR